MSLTEWGFLPNLHETQGTLLPPPACTQPKKALFSKQGSPASRIRTFFSIKTSVRILSVLVISVWAVSGLKAQTEDIRTEIIKLGTLLTEESDWGIALKQMNAELIKESGKRLRFELYFGRNEEDLNKFISSRQLDAVSLSVPGLAEILSEIYIFQLPLLFDDYKELDHVRDELTEFFARRFREKGYDLMGWGDLGFAYLYSKQSLKTQTDLKNTTLWVMDTDRVAKAFALEAVVQDPVLLPVQNVRPRLESGTLKAVYGPPLACIGFLWHPHIKYMTDFPLVAGVGATIISSTRLQQLPPELLDLLKKNVKTYHDRLIDTIRRKNADALNVLKEQGIEVVPVPDREKQKWHKIAKEVRDNLVGELYDQALLDRVERLLSEYRRKYPNHPFERLP